MPTPERVQALKVESTADGGTDSEKYPFPTSIKPQLEALESAGLYVQDGSNRDYNVLIDRSGSDLRFTDTSTGTVALQNLSTLLLNHKRAVAVASIGSNIALTGTYSLDGYTINVGDRVLAKDQTTGSDNGIYIAAAGAWTRAADMATSAMALPGLQTQVLNGTTNAGTTWRMTNTSPPTLGSTALTFAAFPGASYTNGAGLTLTGSTFSVSTNGVADTMIRQSAGLSVIGRSANSTGNVADIVGTASRVLAVNNVNVLGFTTVTGAMTATNTMTDAKLAQRGALTIMGNATNATANVADITATAASDAVLRESGSTLGFGTIATGGIANNAVTDAKLRQSAALSLIGRSANSAGNVADISATAGTGYALIETGSTLVFGQVPSNGIQAHAISDVKLRQSAALSIIGRSVNTSGDVADISATAATDAVLRESGSTIGFGTIATGGIANNAVTNAKLRQGSAYSVIGVTGNATANVADIAAGSTTGPLRASGSALGFRKDNYNGLAAPTTSNDNTQGYEVGSLWIDNSPDSCVYFCVSAATGAAAWSPTLGNYTVTSNNINGNAVTDAKLRQSAGLSVIGRSISSTGNVADITASVTGPLRATAAALGFRKDNYGAAVAPTTGDDNTAGYEIGSIWINTVTDTAYTCVDASTGAAVWATGSGAPAGGKGVSQVDFGATNAQEATLVITGQTGIVSGSNVTVAIVPVATTDHSADEHMIDPPSVFAGTIVPGTGFTIYANAYNNLGSQSYGKWSVAWMWS